MIISIWIPIILTIIAIIWWINVFDVPGWADEFVVTLLAGGAWLVYLTEKSIRATIESVIQGDIVTIISILLIGVGIALYIRYKK